MQAIHTKYIPATETRAAKIKAYNYKHPRGLLVSIDYDLDDIHRHFKAAREFLAQKFPYEVESKKMNYGCSADNKGYCFCFTYSTVEVDA